LIGVEPGDLLMSAADGPAPHAVELIERPPLVSLGAARV